MPTGWKSREKRLARIERQFFEGAGLPQEGKLYPDLHQPGLGLTLKVHEAEPYRCA